MLDPVAELVVLPLAILFSWWQFVNAPNPRNPGLRKAAHGAGIVALALLAALVLNTTEGIGHFLAPGLSGERLYAVLAWAVALIVGLNLLRTGVLLSPAVFDAGGVAVGGLVKIAVGAGVAFIVWDTPADWFSRDVLVYILMLRIVPYGRWAVMAVIVWCAVTGLTKLLLAVRGRARRSNAPPAVPNPRGEARDMTPAEARAAMQGTGGMKSYLDDEEF